MKQTPPHSAIQHTRCVLALTAVKAFTGVEVFPPLPDIRLNAHIQKIRRWAQESAATTKTKKLSAGARRDLGKSFHAMTVKSSAQTMDGETLFTNWAASIWCALTLIEDCRNTCPAYFKGRAWRFLLQTLTTLAMSLYKLEPAIAEQGTELYTEVAL